jgi:hypothetical protein
MVREAVFLLGPFDERIWGVPWPLPATETSMPIMDWHMDGPKRGLAKQALYRLQASPPGKVLFFFFEGIV